MAICPACRSLAEPSSGARCVRDGRYWVSEAALAQSDGDPLLGLEVGGRFVVAGLAAVGGQTAVYDALDRELSRSCLLKVRRGELAAGGDLAREAALLRRAPCVPLVRGAGVAEHPEIGLSFSWIAMNEAPGRSLERLERVTGSELVAVSRTLTLAVAALHEASVVHGDLKPAHVFWQPGSAAVTLIDLGSAVAPFAPGQPAAELTPSYAAPERERTGATAAADVFAIGRIVLWLAGAARPCDLPAPLGAAIERALASDAARRPSAARLAELLG